MKPIIPARLLRDGSSASDAPSPKQDFAGGDDRGVPLWGAGMPETDLQALMEAAPHDDPQESKESRSLREQAIRDRVQAALDQLDEPERLVVMLHFYQGLGYRGIASVLTALNEADMYDGPTTKTTIHRMQLLQSGMAKLKEILGE